MNSADIGLICYSIHNLVHSFSLYTAKSNFLLGFYWELALQQIRESDIGFMMIKSFSCRLYWEGKFHFFVSFCVLGTWRFCIHVPVAYRAIQTDIQVNKKMKWKIECSFVLCYISQYEVYENEIIPLMYTFRI